MHSTNSKEKKQSTSQIVHSPMQSSESVESRSGLIYSDPDVDEEPAYFKFNVPGDGSCLFWAVTMAYLIPVVDDTAFKLRYEDMFGNDETAIANFDNVRTLIKRFNPLSHGILRDATIAYFVTNVFRNRVVDFIERNLDRFECFSEIADEQYRLYMRDPDTWSGDVEIQAISLILNCRINVDGQIFPLVSNTEQPNHNFKKLTLKLFHVGAGGTEKANHFNYGLDYRLIEDFCEEQELKKQELETQELKKQELETQELKKQELETQELETQELETQDLETQELEKYLGEKTENCIVGHSAEHDCNDPENNSLGNSKESNITSATFSVFYFIMGMYCKVMNRIRNEVKHEAVCEHKVNKTLHKSEKVSKQNMYTLFPLFKNPKHESEFFETFKNIAEKNKLLKFFLIILKILID